jgi:hypothetical protein
MYRDECKYFCVIEKEWGDDYYCKLWCGKRCFEGPMTYCKDYEDSEDRERYLKKHGLFTKKDFEL